MIVERIAKIVPLIGDSLYSAWLKATKTLNQKQQLHSLPISAKFCQRGTTSLGTTSPSIIKRDNCRPTENFREAVLIFEPTQARTKLLGVSLKPSESHPRATFFEGFGNGL